MITPPFLSIDCGSADIISVGRLRIVHSVIRVIFGLSTSTTPHKRLPTAPTPSKSEYQNILTRHLRAHKSDSKPIFLHTTHNAPLSSPPRLQASHSHSRRPTSNRYFRLPRILKRDRIPRCAHIKSQYITKSSTHTHNPTLWKMQAIAWRSL